MTGIYLKIMFCVYFKTHTISWWHFIENVVIVFMSTGHHKLRSHNYHTVINSMWHSKSNTRWELRINELASHVQAHCIRPNKINYVSQVNFLKKWSVKFCMNSFLCVFSFFEMWVKKIWDQTGLLSWHEICFSTEVI